MAVCHFCTYNTLIYYLNATKNRCLAVENYA